jgi:hypothetical protein
MTLRRTLRMQAVIAIATGLIAAAVGAHSASDAYLALELERRGEAGGTADTVVRGQWDIALRDLDFVSKLDDDGDGNITWGELRRHQDAIARYAYANINVNSRGKACAIRPVRQLVANHADGAYAALFFDIVCVGAVKQITLDYRLFFAVDPSHRGILVLRAGGNTSTSLLSPDNGRIELKL